ncbi:MAG TPA: aldo/keto reductase [Myxococcales bacterium]
MQFRSFPTIPGLPISTLGFGCMRLPLKGRSPADIDEEAATRLLHDAIDAGVNYVDTAWVYHAGQSEPLVARALRGGYREKVQLATKHPVWLVQSEADWERYLDLQLKKLETNRIDFYLLHALDAERWETVRRHRGLQAMEKALRDGRIGHLGFSFHGSQEAFRTIVAGYDWDFCQIQLNYLDTGYQAGLEGMRLAAERKIGVVVMEPLRGGALAKAPAAVETIWAESGRSWSPAEWALRWVWNLPEVVTVLSGMNAPEQLRENLAVAEGSRPGTLTAAELELVDRARRIYQGKAKVPCTTCGYCLPCPHDVFISDALSLYNAALMFDSKERPAATYQALFVSDGAGADQCIRCGECEPKCPQGIKIPDLLADAHAYLMSP